MWVDETSCIGTERCELLVRLQKSDGNRFSGAKDAGAGCIGTWDYASDEQLQRVAGDAQMHRVMGLIGIGTDRGLERSVGWMGRWRGNWFHNSGR